MDSIGSGTTKYCAKQSCLSSNCFQSSAFSSVRTLVPYSYVYKSFDPIFASEETNGICMHKAYSGHTSGMNALNQDYKSIYSRARWEGD